MSVTNHGSPLPPPATAPTTAGSASAEGTYQPCSVPLRLIIDGVAGLRCNCPTGHVGPHLYLKRYARTDGPQSVVTTYNAAEVELTALRAAVVEYFAALVDHNKHASAQAIKRLVAAESALRRLATEQP